MTRWSEKASLWTPLILKSTLSFVKSGTLKVPEYAWMRSVRMKEHDFMFSQEEMDSMLGLLYVENNANVMAMDYLLAWCLLRKDLPRFFECHKLLLQV